MTGQVSDMAVPSLAKRLLSVLYDGLLLAAVELVAAFPLAPLLQHVDPSLAPHLTQAYVLLVAGAYFSIFWHKGQTLAMKTWRFKLVAADGGQASWGRVWLRYLLACLNILSLGVGWWYALFRDDRQFLQDRLAGTRLVVTTTAG